MKRKTERELLIECVPTNWCDPLLTGPKAVLPKCGEPITPRHIEALLRAIRDAMYAVPAKRDARRARK
ncbi:MAG: hypothetical protein AB7F22_30180 [Reyranella sp.]|uniref:hypothetical protein n=1 Tax=Reyranella sp. TaxID=1929291 RepID=UPI003D0A6450